MVRLGCQPTTLPLLVAVVRVVGGRMSNNPTNLQAHLDKVMLVARALIQCHGPPVEVVLGPQELRLTTPLLVVLD